jgi:hypothetical protein
MSPIDTNGNEYDSFVTQGPGFYWQVLANPGNEYVVFHYKYIRLYEEEAERFTIEL